MTTSQDYVWWTLSVTSPHSPRQRPGLAANFVTGHVAPSVADLYVRTTDSRRRVSQGQ